MCSGIPNFPYNSELFFNDMSQYICIFILFIITFITFYIFVYIVNGYIFMWGQFIVVLQR